MVIQASGIGYYGNTGDRQLTENAAPGTGFLADIAQQWEQSTAAIKDQGVRQVVMRIGPVLGQNGGFLSRAKLPFTFFMGGYFGNGRQWLSWIHLADVVATIQFLLATKNTSGIYHLVAPNPVTSRDFAKSLGKIMRRPAWLPVPAFALKLALGTLAEELLLAGQRAIPQRLQQAGYPFQFTHLEPALEDL